MRRATPRSPPLMSRGEGAGQEVCWGQVRQCLESSPHPTCRPPLSLYTPLPGHSGLTLPSPSLGRCWTLPWSPPGGCSAWPPWTLLPLLPSPRSVLDIAVEPTDWMLCLATLDVADTAAMSSTVRMYEVGRRRKGQGDSDDDDDEDDDGAEEEEEEEEEVRACR